MSEDRELYFSQPLIDEALSLCRELINEQQRDFVTVSRRLTGQLGLSFVDVRLHLTAWYTTVRSELEARGEDVSGTSPPTEVTEAARWLNLWLSDRTSLYSATRDLWNERARDCDVLRVRNKLDCELYGLGIQMACSLLQNGEQDFVQFARSIARELEMPLAALQRYYRSWYEGARFACLDNGIDVSGCSTDDQVCDALAWLCDWDEDPGDTCSVSRLDVQQATKIPTEDELRCLMGLALNAPTPDAVMNFLDFAQRMKRLAPYNMLMVFIQRPGARIVASRKEWEAVGQTVLTDAIPIVVLQPMGPIRYIFEVGDTVPPRVLNPFTDPLAATGNFEALMLESLIAGLRKARSRGLFVDVVKADLGENYSGSIVHAGIFAPQAETAPLMDSIYNCATIERDGDGKVHWRIRLNRRLEPAQSYATLVHELGHLFCGHVGSFGDNNPRANEFGWPDRSSLPTSIKEIEAELVAWHSCDRLGLVTGAPLYLRSHLEEAQSLGVLDLLSLDRVIRSIARVCQYSGKPRAQ